MLLLLNIAIATQLIELEHDFGGNDGVEGDIDVPIPISKGVAYRVPFSGKVYAFWDNITVTYGQNLAPVDPFMSLFEYQKHRDPGLAIPRRRRDVSHSKKKRVDSLITAGVILMDNLVVQRSVFNVKAGGLFITGTPIYEYTDPFEEPADKEKDQDGHLYFNALTLASEACMEDLMMQARKIKYDVIGLTETRRHHPLHSAFENGEDLPQEHATAEALAA
ncbi:unnamed protein product [Haemonchus placei]|uniref:CHASE2 domain-containing protein n=1 Tax=Haemonchus placei TaxID=6290 RepID=A0A0N4WMI8_HAEPC|nr:unnamed protein product [Haemonchus placei]